MKKIFIDCGTNVGQALDDFNESHGVADGTWDLHLFEANPNLTGLIKKYIVEKQKHLNITFHPYAVVGADAPEEIEFRLHKQPEQKNAIGGGSTIVHPDKLMENELAGYEKCFVKTVRLAVFLFETGSPFADDIERADGVEGRTLNRNACRIILKLDVEGAEYEILEDLVNTGVGSWLTELHVEFHGRRFKEDRRADEVRLIGELFQQGVHSFPRK